MNKFIKQLIESIDDEDFFSDLGYDTEKEVTFLVDDNLYPKNAVILGSNPTLKDIENMDHIGAILSNLNGDWILWNLNNEYWDPFGTKLTVPTDVFGEIIAVCIGKGMFAKVNWTGLTNKYSWGNVELIDNTKLEDNIIGSSFDFTMNIINNYSKYIQDTIWEHLVEESTNDYLLYLPNKEELETIWNNVGNYKKYKNTNIYNLLSLATINYWSRSLYADPNGYYYYAYSIYFYNGYVTYNFKTIMYRSVALLHF